MEKINIAELLKDCPQGMELDCTIWDNVTFECVDDREEFSIIIRLSDGCLEAVTDYGCYSDNDGAKCVIFPKGKTTWEGFVPPCEFKDGDIVYVKSNKQNEYIIIFKEIRNEHIHKYVCFAYQHLSIDKCALCHLFDAEIIRLATEEEKAKLFQTIKDNGYRWNAETKTLEKLIQPKFKVGNRIRLKENHNYIYTITGIREKENKYECGVTFVLRFSEQDNWELAPDKFDITSLKPFDQVLVRDFDNTPWEIEFFSRLLDGKQFKCFELSYVQCIPYKGNEHLLGKKDDCNEYFKTWK